MDMDKAAELLTNAIKGFHGRFKIMYGQICIRVDKRVCLSTGGNKMLAGILPEEFEVCDLQEGWQGEIFRNRPDVNAIIFGCSADTVKASQDRDAVAVTLEDLARLTGPYLRVIDDASPASILAGLKDSDVCLVKGTGAIAACSNARKAVAAIQIVEKACEAEVHGSLIGGTVAIPEELAEKYRANFISDYTRRNEEPHVEFIGFDEDEFAARAQLVDFGMELVKQDLSYGSWGNLSVRLNDEEMLITPSSMDYFDIKVEDIVKVNINTLEYGSQRIPSTESRMHALAYRQLPDCGAIMHTRSNALSVFAACEAGFRLGGGELQDLIGDILVTAYAPPGTAELAATVVSTLKKTHACIIPHHGGVFYGPSLDVVFAIAEAVELKARNLLGFDTSHLSEDEN
ncbi:MAG: class II aldolase/adducin family protein [Mogibacterium sp.]|nr:class II aldolase/adducin family protein [Mogibacterium sp.]